MIEPTTRPRLRGSTEAGTVARCHHDPVPLSVVIVDDHPGFRSFARALLEADGFRVLAEATDAASAIAACEQVDPDVLLLDVVLPGADGFWVCEELVRRQAARPAVVLTSSRPESAYTSRLAGSRARGFVAKEELSAAAVRALVEPDR